MFANPVFITPGTNWCLAMAYGRGWGLFYYWITCAVTKKDYGETFFPWFEILTMTILAVNWPNPPFWTGFQPVSSLHNRHFFRVSAGERRQARSEWEAPSATGKTQKKQQPVHVPFFCCIPPQTYPLYKWRSSLVSPLHSLRLRACLRSPEKHTPVMQASQLAWYGNGWSKRDLQHKTAKLDVR